MIPHPFRLRRVCVLLAISVACCPLLRADTFAPRPDLADAQVSSNNQNPPTFQMNTGDFAARIGEFFSPGGSAYVLPFLLPTLPTGQQFTDANIRFILFGKNNDAGSLGNVDFYGLGVRATPAVQNSDYFQGMLDATAGVVRLQDNFLTSGLDPRGVNGSTGSFTTASFADYLNTVDPDNSAAGKYVFFRLSYDVDPPTPAGNNFYSVLTANAGGFNDEQPILNLTSGATTVPEPSTFVMVGLALGAMPLLRRWVRRVA